MPRTCVFCSSSTVATAWHTLARELGAAIARSGDDLVYGGTTTGLMGEVASGARQAGGSVVGVLPADMRELWSVDERCELVLVGSLGERKQAMVRDAHRVVVLPGGLGTLDELLEVLTFRQLGLVDSEVDVVLLDPDGFWQPLLDQFAAMLAAGTVRGTTARVRIATTVAEAVGGVGPTVVT